MENLRHPLSSSDSELLTVETNVGFLLEPAGLGPDVELPTDQDVVRVEHQAVHVSPDQSAVGFYGQRGETGRLDVQQHAFAAGNGHL